MTFPEVLEPDPESKCLFQEDFHCNVALRNYERAWCAGRAEESGRSICFRFFFQQL